MAILDPQVETVARESIEQIQLERLQATLNRVYRHVRYYRQALDQAGVMPEDIGALADLQRLPLTGRDDLLNHQPYDLFAVPLRDVVRLHPAAGAGGPVVVGYTQNDIGIWTRMAARALVSAGVGRDDVIHLSLDYATNAAALGTQSGAEVLGASIIPCSGLALDRQVELMRHYRVTVLVATPTQALQLGKIIDAVGPGAFSLKTALIVGEVWSGELREQIQSLLSADAFASYGLSEMAIPGMATECCEHNGLHISEDNVLAEIIDPATGENLPMGERGELVLTTLTREAAPMIRYRTGDLTALRAESCACGRTTLRMEPAHARADDVVILNGTRLAPSQIEEVFDRLIPGAPFQIVIRARDGQDELEIVAGVDTSRFEDKIRSLQTLGKQLEAEVYEHLGLRAFVRLAEAAYLHGVPRLQDCRAAASGKEG